MVFGYKQQTNMNIYLDFDGTVVEHQYPSIGKYNPGCIDVLQKLQFMGHELILNTYRADCADGTLEEAIQFMLDFFGTAIHPIQKIEPIKVQPTSWNWAFFKTNQVIFLDDICKGIPLRPASQAEYDMVDWSKVDTEMVENKIKCIELFYYQINCTFDTII